MTKWIIDAIAGWLSGLRFSEPDALALPEAGGRGGRFAPSRRSPEECT